VLTAKESMPRCAFPSTTGATLALHRDAPEQRSAEVPGGRDVRDLTPREGMAYGKLQEWTTALARTLATGEVALGGGTHCRGGGLNGGRSTLARPLYCLDAAMG
jgi:hypothetical protein